MNEVKCMYVSEEERKKIIDSYTSIMKQSTYNSSANWEKSGEYFRQFSIYSVREVETHIQNK